MDKESKPINVLMFAVSVLLVCTPVMYLFSEQSAMEMRKEITSKLREADEKLERMKQVDSEMTGLRSNIGSITKEEIERAVIKLRAKVVTHK